jgi:hypothetical protein
MHVQAERQHLALRDARRLLPEGGKEPVRVRQGDEEAVQVLAVHGGDVAVEARLSPDNANQPPPLRRGAGADSFDAFVSLARGLIKPAGQAI